MVLSHVILSSQKPGTTCRNTSQWLPCSWHNIRSRPEYTKGRYGNHSRNMDSKGLHYYRLLFEWQGMSCLRLFSSICSVWLNDPSSSCTVTLRGPLKTKITLDNLMGNIIFLLVRKPKFNWILCVYIRFPKSKSMDTKQATTDE